MNTHKTLLKYIYNKYIIRYIYNKYKDIYNKYKDLLLKFKNVLFQITICYVVLSQLYLNLCDPMDNSLPGSSVHGDSLGKNTGVGCHALLSGISPTQGSNPGLLHCRQSLYHLSH